MLAEKYFPQGSGRYGRLATIVEKMDGFASLKPERWFGIWAMVLAGANVSAHVEDRWLYWDWSSLSYVLLVIFAFAAYWDKRFPVFFTKDRFSKVRIMDVFNGVYTVSTGHYSKRI